MIGDAVSDQAAGAVYQIGLCAFVSAQCFLETIIGACRADGEGEWILLLSLVRDGLSIALEAGGSSAWSF